MTKDEAHAALFDLVTMGLVEAYRCADGEVRYQLTEAGRRHYQDGNLGEDPDTPVVQ